MAARAVPAGLSARGSCASCGRGPSGVLSHGHTRRGLGSTGAPAMALLPSGRCEPRGRWDGWERRSSSGVSCIDTGQRARQTPSVSLKLRHGKYGASL